MKSVFSLILKVISSFLNKKKKGDGNQNLSLMIQNSQIIINGNTTITVVNINNSSK